MYQQQRDIEQNPQNGIPLDELYGQSMQKMQKFGGDHGLASKLFSSILKGIESPENVATQKNIYGPNIPVEKDLTTLWDLIKECFGDTMLQILLVAALLSTIIGMLNDGVATGWTEGATIFLAVFLIVSITAGNNYIKERQFRELSRKLEEGKAQVVRGGVIEIPYNEIVVGDVLLFNLGDVFTVDGLMIQGNSVKIDESSMTGESDEIQKLPYQEIIGSKELQQKSGEEMKGHVSPFLLSGTKCLDGTGQMMVLAVGPNTVCGKLKQLLIQDNPPTPLQQKLECVAEDIGRLGTFISLITFIALMGHMGYDCSTGLYPFLSLKTVQVIIEAFMISVTIIVVAVPEGLPLAVTIALAYSVGKMKDQNNLVKNLSSCEIMGGANNICSDKTGTLTQNIMQVVTLWTENQIFKDQLAQNKSKFNKMTVDLLGECICYNSNAYPEKDKITNKFVQIGNKTECALIEMADNFGFVLNQYRPSDKILRQIPFSSKRKKMSTAVYNQKNQFIRVYTKGASEIVLQQCVKYIGNNGQEQLLDQNQRNNINKTVIEKFANESLRTIAIAYRDLEPQSHASNIRGNISNLTQFSHSIPEDDLDRDLVLIAIVGIKDPIRPGVPDSIKQCHVSGVRVRMVTGDNILTATAIAKECGILDHSRPPTEFEVIEGKKFREFVGGLKIIKDANGKEQRVVGNAENFSRISKDMKVMARASPEDKYILATGLIAEGNVIAVTGDGTNDAPALKKADVGFAMGIAGSDVAKDAADIILLDDNFSSIIVAMMWGRNIYDCIRKFIQFQLTVNLVALFMSFLGALVLKESPLNAIEMLWVNLIMDTFASLALATEPPSPKVLERQPYKRTDNIISPTMYRTIAGASIYQIIVLLFVLFMLPHYLDLTLPPQIAELHIFHKNVVQMSIFFQAFVLMQVFNSVSCRQLDYFTMNPFANFCNNPLFWIVQGSTLIVQFLVVQFGGAFVKVVPLTLEQHIFCILCGVGSIIFGVLTKFVPESLCQKVHIFREDSIAEDKMDDTLTSKLRRKSTMRLHTSSKRSMDGNSLNRISSQRV